MKEVDNVSNGYGMTDEMRLVLFEKGAKWFYWIAGFSVLNTMGVILKFNGTFVVGLGVNILFDIFAYNYQLFALYTLSFIMSALFGVIGYFSLKRYSWIYLAGIILYVLDTILCLYIRDFFMAGFHVVALFNLIKGFAALKGLQRS